jgi:hypothetical protein
MPPYPFHPAYAEPPQKVTGQQISTLIRTTMIAIEQGNVTGNYTVLRDLGAMLFYYDKSASILADIFRPLREQQIDLSATVLQDPLMSEPPSLTADGVLRLKGWFPQELYNIKFDMTFRFEYEKWRVLSIGIELEALDKAGAPAKPGDGQAKAAPAKAKQQ